MLIVPEGTVYKNPQNIALANDFMEDELSYEFLDNFATMYNATVEQVHVNILPSDFSDLKEEVVEVDDGETHKSVTVIRDRSVKKGLDYFIETHNIDLLALHLPERTFAEDLLHRSVSKQIALSSKNSNADFLKTRPTPPYSKLFDQLPKIDLDAIISSKENATPL